MKREMVHIRFTKETRLPNFTMAEGERWWLAKDRLSERGFKLGGGWVYPDRYEVVPIAGHGGEGWVKN